MVPSVPDDELERMMDEIAAATSVSELKWLRGEVARAFAAHPRRAELDRLIDQLLHAKLRAEKPSGRESTRD